jgi:hypothetical protein
MNLREAGLLGTIKAKEVLHKLYLKKITDYNKNPNLCFLCKIPLSYKQRKNKFCSHSCSQKLHNIGVRRHGGDPKKCKFCGNDFRHAGLYCSIKCHFDYDYSKWVERMESLGYFEGYKGNDSGGGVAKPKRYILFKQNGKCAICGITEWQGKPVPFVLDHIDGNSTNWEIKNIRVICRNCDGQLPTYCGRNRGKGKRTIIHSRQKDGFYIKRSKRLVGL